MRRRLIWMVAVVICLAHLAAWIAYERNGREATGGRLTLSERELRLPPPLGDSTSLVLALRWEHDGVAADRYRFGGARWFTVAKLEELGFDCRVPPGETHARNHYRSAGLRPAYVVLELRTDRGTGPGPESRSRLYAIDAGADPVRLRQAHADPARYAIVQGLVRVFVETEDPVNHAAFAEPRLLGRVVELLPGAISVRRPDTSLLQPLRKDWAGGNEGRGPARFKAVVSWGASYLPRLESVNLEP